MHRLSDKRLSGVCRDFKAPFLFSSINIFLKKVVKEKIRSI
jgi:hypothetical protein